LFPVESPQPTIQSSLMIAQCRPASSRARRISRLPPAPIHNVEAPQIAQPAAAVATAAMNEEQRVVTTPTTRSRGLNSPQSCCMSLSTVPDAHEVKHRVRCWVTTLRQQPTPVPMTESLLSAYPVIPPGQKAP